jgi:voltage-gated potassium channel
MRKFIVLWNANVPFAVRIAFSTTQFILSVVVCVGAITTLSSREIPLWWSTLRTMLIVFFIIDFCVRAKVFDGPLYRFLLKSSSFVDILSLVSMLVSFDSWLSLSYLRALVGLEAFRNLRVFWVHKLKLSNVDGQKLILIAEVTTLVFVFSCSIFILENIGNPEQAYYDPTEWTFFNSIYFTIITAATVGYGDMYAKTYPARILVVLFVIIGIWSFTNHISKLAEYIRESAKGKGKFDNYHGDPFVIISGNVTFNMVEHVLGYVLSFSRIFG